MCNFHSYLLDSFRLIYKCYYENNYINYGLYVSADDVVFTCLLFGGDVIAYSLFTASALELNSSKTNEPCIICFKQVFTTQPVTVMVSQWKSNVLRDIHLNLRRQVLIENVLSYDVCMQDI